MLVLAGIAVVAAAAHWRPPEGAPFEGPSSPASFDAWGTTISSAVLANTEIADSGQEATEAHHSLFLAGLSERLIVESVLMKSVCCVPLLRSG